MANNVSVVQKMYIEYFGRPADPEGLHFWVSALDNNPNNYDALLAQIQTDFATSAEYQRTYAGMDNGQIIQEVYHNLFGRDGDAEGVAFWTNALNVHAISVENMVVEIANGAQTADKIVLTGRLAVATDFTNRVDTPTEIQAYMGDAAFAKASAFLDTIVDLSSGAAAIDPGVIDAKIAEIVGTRVGGVMDTHIA